MRLTLTLLMILICMLSVACSNSIPADTDNNNIVKNEPLQSKEPKGDQVQPQKAEEPKTEIEKIEPERIKSKSEQPKATETAKDDITQIIDLINDYEINFVEAVNNNKFALIEKYIEAGSSLYDYKKKQISDLYKEGIKEKYVYHETGFIFRESENSSIYRVEIFETVEIAEPGKDKACKDFQWFYTINKKDGKFKISKIDKWESFEEDIKLRQNAVKSDGFYVYPIFENYEPALIAMLNEGGSEHMDGLFSGAEVKLQHDALLEVLRTKGKDFNLVKTEYLENWNTSNNPYTSKRKITLSFIDANSTAQELELYVTLVVEVYPLEKKLNFSRTAKITKVEYSIE